MDYHVVYAQLNRVAPVPLIVQDANETDAARVRTDLLRWHDETHSATPRGTQP
jgi:hypothetical protein